MEFFPFDDGFELSIEEDDCSNCPNNNSGCVF